MTTRLHFDGTLNVETGQGPTTDVPIPDGMTFPRFVAGAWISDPDAYLPRLKESLKAAVAFKRAQIERGGVDFNGARIETDDASQAKLTGALRYADINPAAQIDWKGRDGWFRLNPAQMRALGQVVGAHVQACFTAQRTHEEAIDALTTVAEVMNYDIEAGWPGA